MVIFPVYFDVSGKYTNKSSAKANLFVFTGRKYIGRSQRYGEYSMKNNGFRIFDFPGILYLCNCMQRLENILPINRLFLNIKKRDEFNC